MVKGSKPAGSNPHDALFKRTFSQVEHAAGLLRAVLPAEVVPRIDWATLEQVPGSFVDARLASGPPRPSSSTASPSAC